MCKGESEVIEYDGRTDNVRFITRAELRRYRGSVLNDEITGAEIRWDDGAELKLFQDALSQVELADKLGITPAAVAHARRLTDTGTPGRDPSATDFGSTDLIGL